MRKLLGVVLLLVSGCAELVWVRPGSTNQEFARDKYDCSRESQTSWSGGGTGWAGQAAIANARREAEQQAQELFDMCMHARGWHLEERGGLLAEAQTPPPPPRPVSLVQRDCLKRCDDRDIICRHDFEPRSCDSINANCYSDCRAVP